MVRKAGLNEAVVVQAAIELIDDEGLDALSLLRLSERLGVRSPSLYKHISGLDGLRQGIALWGIQALGQRMSKAAIGKSGDEAVREIAMAYREFAKAHPGVYPLLLRAPGSEEEALEAANADILEIIQAVLSPYGLDPAESVHAIRGLRSFIHGFVSLESGGGFGMPYDIEQSFQYLMAMFLRGLQRNSVKGGTL